MDGQSGVGGSGNMPLMLVDQEMLIKKRTNDEDLSSESQSDSRDSKKMKAVGENSLSKEAAAAGQPRQDQ